MKKTLTRQSGLHHLRPGTFLILIFLLFVSIQSRASAPPSLPVHNIDLATNYATIQEAIDDPFTITGHTIVVDAGTYAENVVLNKSLIINGAQAGVDARGRVIGTPNPATESIIAPVSGIALNYTTGFQSSIIDGFSMIGSLNATNGVITCATTAGLTNVQLKNNFVMVATGFTAPALFLNRGLIDATISNNEFVSASGSAQCLMTNGPQLYHGLYLLNNNILGAGGTGFFVDGNRNVGTSVGFANRAPQIKGNLFQGFAAGINAGSRSFQDVQVLENTFNNNTSLGFQGGPKNCIFERNTFTGNALYGMSLTAFGSSDPLRGGQGTIIQNNFFSGNATAPGAFGDILLSDQTVGTQNSNTITNNSLLSAIAIYNNEKDGGTDPIHATCNWFGTISPVVVATKIFNVATAPGAVTLVSLWLNNGTDNDLITPGFQPVPGSCSVNPVQNLNTLVTYPAIQPALDAASPGDVIEASAGTYNERVVISKSITLQGTAESTVFIDGTGFVGTGKGIQIDNGITNVIIQRLTVQNFAGASGNADAGIYGIGGNNFLTVQHVTIKNNVGGSGFYANGPVTNVTIDSVTSTGHTIGARGIVIWNGLKSNITITNCHVYGNNCCGIELQDGTASGVTMTNNNIHNNGDNGIGLVGLQGPGENFISQNIVTDNGRFGIEIKNPNGSGANSGAGRVVIDNNTVSRTIAIGDVRDIAGIAVFRRGVLAENVDVPTGAFVQNNTVSGYTQSSTSEGFGIVMEGTNHTVTGNIINGNDIGIQRQAGHTPYPGDGDQSNLVDTYFGRGNSPIACGITVSGNTLSNILANGIDTRDVGSSGSIGFITNTTTGKTFCTIQSAIDDVLTADGNTITVAAGTYNENIVINKKLILNGANYNASCLSGRATESIINSTLGSGSTTVTIASDDVTLNGFTVTNPLGSFGIYAQGRSNVNINYNIITNIGDNVNGAAPTYGVAIEMGSTANISNVNITNNCVNNIRGGQNTSLSGLVAKANNGSAVGIGAGFSTADYDISGLSISNNKIDHVTSCINAFNDGGKGAYGISINVGANGSFDGMAVSPVIQNNSISILEGLWAHGVGLEGETPGAMIENNYIDNLVDHKGNTDAVGVLLEDNAGAATVVIHSNSFTNMAYAIANLMVPTIDATCNWYGSNVLATVSSKVGGAVTFIPYLPNGTDIGSNPDDGFQPAGVCTACLDPNTSNAGNDTTVCDGGNVLLNGSVGGSALSGTWGSTGTGFFTPSVAALNAVYHPSPADYSFGSVKLHLTTDVAYPCVEAGSDTMLVVFIPLPINTGPITGITQFCNPGPGATATYSITDIGAATYTWTLPFGLSLISGQNSTSITIGFNTAAIHDGIGGNISVQANNGNGCGSSIPSTLRVTAHLVLPVQPGSISGSDRACPGDIFVYSVASVPRTDIYTWTMPTGATIIDGLNSNVITVQYGGTFVGGTIKVKSGNGCGTSPDRPRSITLNVLPAPVAIVGNATGVCGMTLGYTISIPVVGASNYFWTAPAGASFLGGVNTGIAVTIVYSGSFTGGNVTVAATNNCGNGTARVMNVIGAPGFPPIITGLNPFCATQNQTFSITTVTGASTYNWTKTNGLTYVSGQTTKNYTVTFGGPVSNQMLTVRAVNLCGQSNARILSGIAVVACPRLGDESSTLNLEAYPSPVSELLKVSFNSMKDQNYILNMSDATGRIVMTEVKSAYYGNNEIELSVKSLSSGMYILHFLMGDHHEQIRIFVE